MTLTLDPLQLVIGAAALVGALCLLGRKVHQLVRVLLAASALIHRELGQDNGDTLRARVGATSDVVRRELRPNGGESIKDDVTALAVGLGYLGRGFDDLSERVDALERKERST